MFYIKSCAKVATLIPAISDYETGAPIAKGHGTVVTEWK